MCVCVFVCVYIRTLRIHVYLGAFNEWSAWAPCSASCWIDVDPPTTYRTRSCNSVFNSCIGLYSEKKECNTIICSGKPLTLKILKELMY